MRRAGQPKAPDPGRGAQCLRELAGQVWHQAVHSQQALEFDEAPQETLMSGQDWGPLGRPRLQGRMWLLGTGSGRGHRPGHHGKLLPLKAIERQPP